jgi:MSHA biogenesis protein MshP
MRQRGTSLVIAIFLLVIVASLTAFAVSVGTASRESANLQLQADRALAAAQAGTEWGAYRALRQGACPFGPTAVTLNQSGLRGFRVTVSCTVQAHAEGATNYSVFDIDSFAQWSNFGAANYASRRVTKRVSNAP